MPGMSFRLATMTSRRRRNSATISATPSCGPSSAAIAAYWLNAEVQETELIASRVTGSTSADGNTPKPSRQPVIAYVFDQPSEFGDVDPEAVTFPQRHRHRHCARERGDRLVHREARVRVEHLVTRPG